MEIQSNITTETKPEAQVAPAPKEQVSEGQQTATTTQTVEQNDLGWTEDQKTYIKGLRDENAKYRTRAKERDSEVTSLNERLGKFETGLKTLFGEEGDKLTPEQRVEALQVQNETLAMQTALKDAAFEYGIGKESYDYFEFLVSKKLNALEEGQEISEEELDEIAKMAKSKTTSGNTSVGDGTTATPEPVAGEGGITLDQFVLMGIGERSLMYQKDKVQYDSLVLQERAAKKR